ncbi:MAG: DUF3108 domain-containing protein [Planctomycetota bacterium]
MIEKLLRLGALGALLVTLPAFASATDDEVEAARFHRVERGEGLQDLLIPIGEQLRYKATLRTGVGSFDVGKVTLESGIDPFKRSLLASAQNRGGGDTAWIRAQAYGDYTLYVMDARMETRFQPQKWPFSVHSYRHEGTEKRRRELLTGEKGGEWISSYRGDTSRGAPAGLRIWGDVREQPVPRGSIDSLAAMYLVRTAIRSGQNSLRFHMVDKDRIWDVGLSLEPARDVETPAGTFRGRQVSLTTERIDPKAKEEAEQDEDGESAEFAGPFGIKGNIELLIEESTGVPLVIKGELPVLLGDLEVDLMLTGYEGTPTGFAPIAPPKD